jgi:amidohydrolase
MQQPMMEKIKASAEALFTQLQQWRHHLHAHPELSWQEVQTAAFVIQQLESLGIPYRNDVAGTAVLAWIDGHDPESKCIALRADMDALPIQETNDIPYASCNAGVMHACGHDVHTTWLLGAASILNEMKSSLKGRILLVFQPSEEKMPSGAKAILNSPAFQFFRVQQIFGLHVTPELQVGTIGFHPGNFMASADEIYITIKGNGGHAAQPHLVIDTIATAAQVIVALQQVVSRKAKADMPTVLSFGDIQGHGATNIIPKEVKIKGTLRTFDETWRAAAHEWIRTITSRTAEAMGASAEVDIPEGLPFLYNDPELTERMKMLASKAFGENQIINLPIRMGSEDFAFYSHQIPACFIRIGTGNKEKGISSGIHTSTFDIDEAALGIGSIILSLAAADILSADN